MAAQKIQHVLDPGAGDQPSFAIILSPLKGKAKVSLYLESVFVYSPSNVSTRHKITCPK